MFYVSNEMLIKKVESVKCLRATMLDTPVLVSKGGISRRWAAVIDMSYAYDVRRFNTAEILWAILKINQREFFKPSVAYACYGFQSVVSVEKSGVCSWTIHTKEPGFKVRILSPYKLSYRDAYRIANSAIRKNPVGKDVLTTKINGIIFTVELHGNGAELAIQVRRKGL